MNFHKPLFHLLCLLLPVSVSAQTPMIVNEPFVQASYIEMKAFVGKYKPTLLTKEKIVNEYNPSQTDYLLTYGIGKDRFRFYKTPEKALTLSYHCTTPLLVLAKGVHVGMSQEDFERVFKRRVMGMTVELSGAGDFELYTFTFARRALIRIAYESRVD